MGVGMMQSKRRILMDTPHLITPTAAELHTFSTDMMAPLKECKVHFSPVQEGTGDPNPVDNVRPISGWTGIELTRCGKNLFNLADFAKAGWTEVQDAEYPDTYTGRKWRFTGLHGGRASLTSNSEATGLLPKRLPLGRVALSWYDYNTSNWRVYFHYDDDTNWDNHSGNITSVGLKKSVSIANKNCDGVALDTTQGQTANGQIGMVQVEIGSEFTDYEPFNGVVLPIDWSSIGEIYGGYIDLIRGVLVATLKGKRASELTWVKNDTHENGFNGIGFTDRMRRIDAPDRNDCFCDSYPWTYSTTMADFDYAASLANAASGTLNNRTRIYVVNKDYTEVSDFVASFQTYDPLFVLPLDTPVEYTIDPVTLKTLRGLNNIWSNANGVIELSYWKH